uniref:Receptor expression-enhancing protein n=1 Tax=Hemiselmis tepida TaxID=464990 RepID=A0A7S0YTQ7_9CRYP|mmetsp:Transcript_21256/g.53522  ORF Transcript_21256/g.53522 Transcript_21256/m.53522 type:complete len:129 (+) Transcript_21256:91-477(+)|eukprot:CAMPEP_0174917616 /NCGR_PEP_ID=MMETSP1355-20121228/2577_1 /TAXON_ID=464990 /ORGANISM="Hemiselmis tepida, Strain CCMP443" /LENGTH=128 /DNA_ID=CAMNT_0016162727 /DNA_START=58 /DNA_END=444 /DNA_ORIENTATION=-
MIGFWGSKLLCMLVGVIYPALMSYKAIKSTAKDTEDHTQWLTYWVIFSLFSTVEFLLDVIIVWIPIYYELKLCFVLWMALPQTNGALWIWIQSEKTIDQYMTQVENWGEKFKPKKDKKEKADAASKDD